VQAIADRAVQAYGRLDTWVHAASVLMVSPFDKTTPEEFRQVVQVNLVGQAYGAMAALPYLRQEGRGALIMVSSIEAHRAFPLQSAYSASKHGVRGLVKALRIELQKDGGDISLTEIIPAATNTPLFNKALTKLGVEPGVPPPVYKPETAADAIMYAAEHPVPEIVVGAAGFLLVQLERWASGQLDTLLKWFGFRFQRSTREKSDTAPHNLFRPISGYDRVEGDYSGPTFPSLYTWLVTHKSVRQIAVSSLVLGLTAWIGFRTLRGVDGMGMQSRQPRWRRRGRRLRT
jgi:NAD(P)-dependent dehydrogenase (short-subunit alcohol dehydrogenase family)